MKWLKSFPDGRGGFDSMEWDMGDVGMEYFINIFKYIFFGFLLCVFICPILLYAHSGECKEARIRQYWVSIALGLLFLFDAAYGGFFWTCFVADGEPGSVYIWVVTLIYVCLCVHSIMYMLDSQLEWIYDNFSYQTLFDIILWFIIIFLLTPGSLEVIAMEISHEPMSIFSESYYKVRE